MTQTQSTPVPFIIWTMQRTGGTNLSRNLLEMSPFRAEQEPFNRPRVYGHIMQAWEKDRFGDEDTKKAAVANVEKAVHDILAKNENIKHCVEMVPWRISSSLAKASVDQDYKSLFLIRENSLQRLLSMEYARRTKVWGPSHEKPDEATDPAFDAPLDIDALLEHETMGITRLNDFWKSLKAQGAKPHVISFEQVYEADFETACAAVSATTTYLGFDCGDDQISEMTSKMRDVGNQNTRNRYDRFDGIDDLRRALEKLPDYVFFKSDRTAMLEGTAS
ncbi:hypothetical protein [Thalassococcus sp. S3]|uniref:hypothetical protein n=1 Tax=Thalassococcus sp. S3 TaxID=2017482 RepID=UPI00102437B8|nr:hypothetical protein [Thalassococcus sp. S3]QBF34266.1 hypothetical protein CFI11_24070 [Thalassococcus sp. S3]